MDLVCEEGWIAKSSACSRGYEGAPVGNIAFDGFDRPVCGTRRQVDIGGAQRLKTNDSAIHLGAIRKAFANRKAAVMVGAGFRRNAVGGENLATWPVVVPGPYVCTCMI